MYTSLWGQGTEGWGNGRGELVLRAGEGSRCVQTPEIPSLDQLSPHSSAPSALMYTPPKDPPNSPEDYTAFVIPSK